MKSFFSKKLYWEGIKKVKVIGVAFTAISTVLCALIPFISLLDWYATEKEYRVHSTVSAMEFSIPAYLILMAASVIVVLNMFSYLNKRSESDFYHAIPYKRSCVYISFMAACLSWLLFAALLSIAAAAFFCCIHPGLSLAWSIPFVNLGICILLCATLAATTVVAMTLTGSSISNLLILVLLIGFVPVVGFLFVTALDVTVPILHIPLTPARFLMPEFSLPLAVFQVMMTGYNESILFNNPSMIVYTVIVTLVMLVLGCLFYMIRKSEMATKSAPNKLLQHIYRCAVSLPFALLAAMGLYLEGGDAAYFIVLVVITLIVYFMYELLTTRSFKNLVKALPFLGVLVAGGLLFVGGTELAKAATLSYTPEADEIKSVGLLSESSYEYYDYETSYENIMTTNIEIDHPEARQIIAKALADSVELVRDNIFYDVRMPEEEGYTYRRVKITDRSGKVCGRYIRISLSDSNRLSELFLGSEDYADALIKMPSDKEIDDIYLQGNIYMELDQSKYYDLWKTFLFEYNALSDAQKLDYKSHLYNSNVYTEQAMTDTEIKEIDPAYSIASFTVWGAVGTETFNSEYPIRPDLFPKTCAHYAELVNHYVDPYADDYEQAYGDDYNQTYGPDALREILPLFDSERTYEFHFYTDLPNLSGFYYNTNFVEDTFTPEQIAMVREIAEFMLEHTASAEDAVYYTNMYTMIYQSGDDGSAITHDNTTVIALSEEDYQTLSQLFDQANKSIYPDQKVTE